MESESAGCVGAGHKGGEVVRFEERWRRRRSPVEEALSAFEGFWGPDFVFGDAVHVGVVLGEVPCRVFEVPEEVGSGVVSSKSPDVAFGVVLEHGFRAASDVVDVVDLPRGVVEKVHGCGQGPGRCDVPRSSA